MKALDTVRRAEWTKTHRAVERGVSLPDAMTGSGLFAKANGLAFGAAADAGEGVPALQQLAWQAEQRERDVRATRARLGFSIAIFTIASLAVLALALARNPSTAGLLDGLQQLAPRAALFVVFIWTLLAGLRFDLLSALQGLWPTGLVLRMGMPQQWFESVFLDLLRLQLRGGRDFATSLANMRGLIAHDDYAARVQYAAALAEAGGGMTEALEQSGLLPRTQTRAISSAAEAAGSWDEAIGHHLSLLQTDLRRQREACLAWLPRAAYAAAVGLIAPLIL